MKKKIIISVIAAMSALILCLGLMTACVFSTATGDRAYVALDINPSVELTVTDGRVSSVRTLNRDARVMLYGSEGIVGETPEAAARKIAALALEFGYMTQSNSNIGLAVASDDEAVGEKIYGDVSAAIADEAEKSGLAVTVSDDAGAGLERELTELKGQYPDNGAIQNLTAAKYRLIRAAMNADRRLTIETAVRMSLDDLADIVEDYYEEYGLFADDALETEFDLAEYEYRAKAWAIADGAYVAADEARGTEYAALRGAYLTLDRIGEIDSELAEMSALTEDDLLYVAGKLGLDEAETQAFVASATDGLGYVSEDAVEHYLDGLERNFRGSEDEEEEFEELLDELEDYIDDAEDRAQFTAELKAEAEAALAAVEQYVGRLTVDSFDDVEDAAEELEDRIEDLEEYFEDHFTAEQKQIVRDYLESVGERLDEERKAYENALNDIRDRVAAALEEEQRLRLQITA